MKKIVISMFALAFGLGLSAQKIKITKGDLATLKSVDSYLVTFDYSNMAVGKYDKEEDYVEYKSAEAEKRGDKTAEEWKAKWISDRGDRYEPKFIELFSNKLGDNASASTVKGDQKWEVIVHTTFTEPGWNVGISRSPAYLNFTITIREIANPDNQIVITMERVPGQDAMGYDFDSAFRVQESYAKAGKELGAILAKKAYK